MIYLINQLLRVLLRVLLHVHFFCPQRYYVPVFSILLKQQLVYLLFIWEPIYLLSYIQQL
jgi:hypothetical protein